jgi:DNA-binding winged helix-turn-helix (wHTH) protein
MDTAVNNQGVYNFGPFRLDPAERLLLRDGDAVALTPKAFDLLVYLAARPGHLVEKQALMVALWPDAIVEEANLASTVSALRKALDDDGQQFIATVPTRGYRFVAPVRIESPTRPDAASATDASAVRKLQWGLIALFAVCSVLMFMAGWFIAGYVKRASPETLSVRLSIEPAEGIRGPEVLFERWAGRNRPSRTAIALSPDGRRLVLQASVATSISSGFDRSTMLRHHLPALKTAPRRSFRPTDDGSVSGRSRRSGKCRSAAEHRQ